MLWPHIIVFLPHFLHDSWRKIFLTLYSINWLYFIVWLPLFFEILGNMCVVIICVPVDDVINFKISLIIRFLIKRFCYLTKMWKQKFKYLLRAFQSAVLQIEKALINERFTCFKIIHKLSHSNYLKFCSNLPVKFAIFLKNSLLFSSFYCLFCS